MSATQTNPAGRGLRLDIFVGAAVIAVIVVAYMVFAGQRQQVLRMSASGFEGLATWLQADDLDVRSFAGGWSIDQDQIGLAFGHPRGHGADPHLGDKLDVNPGSGIGVFQIVNQLGQILDGVDVVMGRW